MKRLESSVKAPDRNAQFEELYAQYADDVLRMAYFYLADKQKAEDVCQDVFVKLYTRGEAIAPGCEKAWLLRVTVNCCRDLWRSAWLKRVVLGAPTLDIIPAQEETFEQREEKAELEANVADLAKRGGRAKLEKCGDQNRLCVRIDKSAGGFGKDSEYAVLKGY